MNYFTSFLIYLLSLLAGGKVLAQEKIADVLIGNPSFATLVTALRAAGLIDVLRSEGPFTVFAPTNEAFAKIDSGTLNSLLTPENKEALANILYYHAVGGRLNASDILTRDYLTAANGQRLTVLREGNQVFLVNTWKIKAGLPLRT